MGQRDVMRGEPANHFFLGKVQCVLGSIYVGKGFETLVSVEAWWRCCDWSAWLKKMPEKRNGDERKNSFSFLQGTPEGDHEEDDDEDVSEEHSFRM